MLDYHRHPIATAVACLGVLALFLLAAANADRLPLIGGGKTYRAEFGDAAGLTKDSEVRIAGVKVGNVTGLELKDDHVEVSFNAGNTWLGDRTSAVIKIKTLLGAKYLALEPLGAKPLDDSRPIPRNRTVSPMDVNAVLQDLGHTAGGIDANQLAESFRVVANTFRDTPGPAGDAMRGLTALSTTISKRDAELHQLLENANRVTRVAVDRNQDFEQLLSAGNVLLTELRQRRDQVHALLVGTRALSTQLSGVVDDNAKQIGPTLEQLGRVSAQLERNQQNLDRSLAVSGPMYRLMTNVLGNGRWADVYVCGLLPPSIGPVNPQGCKP